MTTQSYPLVVCEIIELPSDLRMINFRCKVAWEMCQDVPSLKSPKPSNSNSDEEFHCEEVEVGVEVKCQDEKKNSEHDLRDRNYLDPEVVHQEENEEKIDDKSCDDDYEQTSYSDIIFSIPTQRPSGDGKVLPDTLENDQTKKAEDEGPVLQSMLLNNFVTDVENNPGKKSLSRRRLRKSLIDNNL